MLICIRFTAFGVTTTTADESFTPAHLFIDLLAAAEKATLAAATGYALTTYLVTVVYCIASDASITTVTSWCIAEKLLLTHIMIMKISYLYHDYLSSCSWLQQKKLL